MCMVCADAARNYFVDYWADPDGGSAIPTRSKPGSARSAVLSSALTSILSDIPASALAELSSRWPPPTYVRSPCCDVAGNLRTNDGGGPYNLTLLNVQEAEVKSECFWQLSCQVYICFCFLGQMLLDCCRWYCCQTELHRP